MIFSYLFELFSEKLLKKLNVFWIFAKKITFEPRGEQNKCLICEMFGNQSFDSMLNSRVALKKCSKREVFVKMSCLDRRVPLYRETLIDSFTQRGKSDKNLKTCSIFDQFQIQIQFFKYPKWNLQWRIGIKRKKIIQTHTQIYSSRRS